MSVRVTRAVEVPSPLHDEAVAAAVTAALADGGRSGLRVDVVLVDDPTLAEMHGRYLGDPSPTDVLAFDLSDGDPSTSGADDAQAEVYASLDCALRVAAERGVDPARELALYLVHGTLHLCGHDDHEPEARQAMRAAEARVLATLGYPPDAASAVE